MVSIHSRKLGDAMLSEKTFNKIVWEYQNGGVISNHPELTTYERKALLKYLFALPTKEKN